MMYLMHYASRVKVDPPPQASQATRDGLPTVTSAQWLELQKVWTAWFVDVKAKGLALK